MFPFAALNLDTCSPPHFAALNHDIASRVRKIDRIAAIALAGNPDGPFATLTVTLPFGNLLLPLPLLLCKPYRSHFWPAT
jgi:hypothetical protein